MWVPTSALLWFDRLCERRDVHDDEKERWEIRFYSAGNQNARKWRAHELAVKIVGAHGNVWSSGKGLLKKLILCGFVFESPVAAIHEHAQEVLLQISSVDISARVLRSTSRTRTNFQTVASMHCKSLIFHEIGSSTLWPAWLSYSQLGVRFMTMHTGSMCIT